MFWVLADNLQPFHLYRKREKYISISKKKVLQQCCIVEYSSVILSMQYWTQLSCSIACMLVECVFLCQERLDLDPILNCFQFLHVASITNNRGKGDGKLCGQIIWYRKEFLGGEDTREVCWCCRADVVAYPEVDWPKVAEEFVRSLGLQFNPYVTQVIYILYFDI